jgi:hypothetical protein
VDETSYPGVGVLIFFFISQKKLATILLFFTQVTAIYAGNLNHNIIFLKKNANFFNKNWQKSQK